MFDILDVESYLKKVLLKLCNNKDFCAVYDMSQQQITLHCRLNMVFLTPLPEVCKATPLRAKARRLSGRFIFSQLATTQSQLGGPEEQHERFA